MAVSGANVTDNIKTLTGQNTDKATDQLFSNYEEFVKLLTVQLENQDPTKPLETDQLTQQIASLSQVEQQINTNKNLEKLMTFFMQSQVSSQVGYMGKLVEAPGNLGALSGGQGIFVYTLAAEASNVEVSISDVDGNVVYSGDGTKLAGRNTFVWDGKNNQGQQMPDGTYMVSVKAKDPSGQAIESSTSSSGKVTSVETIDGITYIALGDILVPMDKIVSVREWPLGTPANNNDTANNGDNNEQA